MKSYVTHRIRTSDTLLLAFVMWIGSYAYLYWFQIGGLKPLYSYFALWAFALVYLLRVSPERQIAGTLNRKQVPYLCWLGALLTYGSLAYVNSTQSEGALQALIVLGETAMVSASFLLLMADRRRIELLTKALAILALFATAMNVWDLLAPTFSKVPGRAAGLYVNPNASGHFIALAMIAGLSAVPRRLRFLYLIGCSIGVLITFSRGAWIAWGIGIVCLGWQARRSNRTLSGAARAALILLLGIAVTSLLFSGKAGSLLGESPMTAFLTPNTAARLGIGSSVLAGDAADVRLEGVMYSGREFAEKPWLGHGLAYTQEWEFSDGPHNMYLLFAVEGGVPGLAVYVSLLLILWRAGSGVGRIIVVQLVVSSLFSHNHLDQPLMAMMMAFVVAHGTVANRAIPRSMHGFTPVYV